MKNEPTRYWDSQRSRILFVDRDPEQPDRFAAVWVQSSSGQVGSQKRHRLRSLPSNKHFDIVQESVDLYATSRQAWQRMAVCAACTAHVVHAYRGLCGSCAFKEQFEP